MTIIRLVLKNMRFELSLELCPIKFGQVLMILQQFEKNRYFGSMSKFEYTIFWISKKIKNFWKSKLFFIFLTYIVNGVSYVHYFLLRQSTGLSGPFKYCEHDCKVYRKIFGGSWQKKSLTPKMRLLKIWDTQTLT